MVHSVPYDDPLLYLSFHSVNQLFFIFTVDERIDVQIKWDFGSNIGLHKIPEKDDTEELLKRGLKMLPLEMISLSTSGHPISLSLKCTGKIKYQKFFANDGPLVMITKTLFSNVSDTILRLSVFVDTSFVNNLVPDSGNVLFFCNTNLT